MAFILTAVVALNLMRRMEPPVRQMVVTDPNQRGTAEINKGYEDGYYLVTEIHYRSIFSDVDPIIQLSPDKGNS